MTEYIFMGMGIAIGLGAVVGAWAGGYVLAYGAVECVMWAGDKLFKRRP